MQGERKTVTILMLTVLILMSLTGCRGWPQQDAPGLEDGLERVMGFYRQEKDALDSWWEMVALYGSGADLESGPWQLPAWVSDDLPPGSAATSYAGFILGLLARGEDPWTWQNRHLPAELASLQHRDGSFGSSINNTIWAMLALDVAGFSYSREEALAYLLKEQKEDGGFALTGSSGDPDVTAMALLALSFQRHNQEVEAAVQASLEYLRSAMLPSGGYASYNEENANSTAVALSALISIGENIEAGPWVQQDGGPLVALLAYQLEDGSFSFFLEPLKGDPMATYQALLALGDAAAGTSVFSRLQAAGEKYRQETAELQQAAPPGVDPAPGPVPKGTEVRLVSDYGHGRIFYTLDGSDPLMEGQEYAGPITLEDDATIRAAELVLGMKNSPVASFRYSMEVVQAEEPAAQKPPPGTGTPPKEEPKPKPPTISVKLRVVGASKTYFNGTVKVPQDKANALQALLESKLKISASGGFVSAVEGEANAGVSGWKFKVNSEIPGVGALSYAIKENDTVLWWYADTPDSTGP